MNLDWLKQLVDKLPETSPARKNLISIAGYPRWENVSSNLLAFYLDESEEHGFKRLFINSLIDLIISKNTENIIQQELLDKEYSVEREVATNKGGRIDILVEGKESQDELDNISDQPANWALIIENKLDAELTNDLSDYWNSIKADNKIGVVISVKHLIIPKRFENKYLNITHSELIESVKQNLSEFYLEADDRHLLFLKEYIANVNSLYSDPNYNQKMDNTLKLFHSRKAEIEKFKKTDLDLLRYVSQSVFEVMRSFDWHPSSNKDSSKGKHFIVNPDTEIKDAFIRENHEVATKFRFWVIINHLRYNPTFIAYFELFGSDNTIYGEKLKNRLEELDIFTEYVLMGKAGRVNYGYYHIYSLSIPIVDFSEEGFHAQLRKSLSQSFFNHKKRFVETAVLELKKLLYPG